jgi:hypothetical protein
MLPRYLAQVLHPSQKFNVRHFGMVEATKLIQRQGYFQWNLFAIDFHKNLLII